jgi:hypothetical protein
MKLTGLKTLLRLFSMRQERLCMLLDEPQDVQPLYFIYDIISLYNVILYSGAALPAAR